MLETSKQYQYFTEIIRIMIKNWLSNRKSAVHYSLYPDIIEWCIENETDLIIKFPVQTSCMGEINSGDATIKIDLILFISFMHKFNGKNPSSEELISVLQNNIIILEELI